MDTISEIIKLIFIPVLTALITVKFSLGKFRTEKWWEKKVQAYAEIINALHHLKNYCEEKLNAEYEQRELSKESEKELGQQYKEAARELIKATDVGSFIISDKAVKVLEVYQNRPKLSLHENDLSEVIEHDIKYVKECLENFKMLAKKDLNIP